MSEPAVVTAVYGEDYAPFLGPLLESLAAVGLEEVVVATGGFDPARAEGLVRGAPEPGARLRVTHTALDEDSYFAALNPAHRRALRFYAWAAALRLLAHGRQVACLDVDTLVVKPLALAFAGPPVPLRYPAQGTRLRVGSCFLVNGPGAVALLKEWSGRCGRLLSGSPEHAKALERVYGSIEAAVLNLLLAQGHEGGGLVGRPVPAPVWCQEAPESPSAAAILHLAGFRPWTGAGAREADADVVAAWHQANTRYQARLASAQMVSQGPAPK